MSKVASLIASKTQRLFIYYHKDKEKQQIFDSFAS